MPDHEFTYWAFLSSSPQDVCEHRSDAPDAPGAPWSDWLRRALETFSVPADFVGHANARGEVIPERLPPVFPAGLESPADASLAANLRTALDQSQCLVVICSPHSAKHLQVNETVRYFKQLGRGNRIFSLVVAGEPNASDGHKPGCSPDDECFVPALRHPVKPDGTLDTTQRDGVPIFADARLGHGQSAGETKLEIARVQLIAGLIGVGFNGLWAREQHRRFAEAQNQAREARNQLQAAQRQLEAAQSQLQNARNQGGQASQEAQAAPSPFPAEPNPETQRQIEQAQREAREAQNQVLEAQRQAQAAQDRLLETRSQLQAAQSQIEETQNQLEAAQDQLQRAHSQAHEVGEPQEDKTEYYEGQLQDAYTELHKAKRLAQEAQSQLQEARSQSQAVQSQLEATQNQLLKAQSQAQEAQGQLQAAQSQLLQAQHQAQDAQAQVDEARSQALAAEIQLQKTEIQAQAVQAVPSAPPADLSPAQELQLQETRSQLQKVQSLAEAAQRQLEEAQTQLRQAQLQAQEAQTQYQESKGQSQAIQNELLETQNQLQNAQLQAQVQLQAAQVQLQEAQNQLHQARQEAEAAQAQIQAAKSQSQATQSQLSETQSQFQNAQRQAEAAELQLQAARTQLQKTQLQAEESQRQVEAARHQSQAIQDQLAESQTQFAQAQRQAQATQVQLQEAQSQLQKTQLQAQEFQAQAQAALSQAQTAHTQREQAESQVQVSQREAQQALTRAEAARSQAEAAQLQLQQAQQQVQAVQSGIQTARHQTDEARRRTKVLAVFAVLALLAAGTALLSRKGPKPDLAKPDLAATTNASAVVPGPLDQAQIQQMLRQVGGTTQENIRRLDELAPRIPLEEIPATLNASSAILDDQQRCHFQQQLLVRLAETNPVSAMASASAIPGKIVGDDGSRDSVLRFQLAVLDRWMQSDLPGATDWARQLPDVYSRDQALGKILPALAAQNPTNALALLNHLQPAAGESSYRLLFEHWATNNPMQAIEQRQQVPNQDAGDDILCTILASWTATQPDAAWDWVKSQPDSEAKNRALETCVTEQAKTDAPKALTRVESLAAGPWQDALVAALFQDWAARDLDAATTACQQLPDGPAKAKAWEYVLNQRVATAPASAAEEVKDLPPGDYRQNTIAELCQRWAITNATTDTNLPSVVTWAQSLSSTAESVAALNLIVPHWARQNPPAAMQFASQHPELSTNVVEDIAVIWAKTDLPAASNWVKSLPDGEKKAAALLALASAAADSAPKTAAELCALLTTNQPPVQDIARIARAFAKEDLSGAIDWARNQKADAARQAAIAALSDTWAERDPQGLATYALSLPAGLAQSQYLTAAGRQLATHNFPAAVELLKPLTDNQLRQSLWEQAARACDLPHLPAAAEYIAAMPAGDDQQAAIRGLLSHWTEPAAALAWLGSFPETNAQPEQVRAVLTTWAITEPAAAGNWLTNMPAAATNQALVSAFLAAAATKYPAYAAQWTQSVTDETERQKYQLQVARQWLKSDPSAAAKWVDSLNLPDALKAQATAP